VTNPTFIFLGSSAAKIAGTGQKRTH